MGTSKPYESQAVRAVTGPTIRPGEMVLTRRAADFCRLDTGDRVLDVGCGTGATVDFLAARYGATVIGLDVSSVLLADARHQHPALNLIRGDAMTLPLKTEPFSAVFCECVCSLLPDSASALKEFYRVLKPGGHLIVADLYWRTKDETALRSPAGAGGCLKGAVDRQTMVQRIETAGFEIGLWEDHADALKNLAAQLVWAGVSLNAWWGVDCTAGEGHGGRRPGYCLTIARKRQLEDSGTADSEFVAIASLS
jgi:arsenite methyltransferase